MKLSVKKRLIEEWCRERDCFWCGGIFAYRGKNAPTIEHFIPRSLLKGAGGQANVVIAHSRCNHKRGARYPTEDEMRAFVKVKGRVGVEVLRLLADSIERDINSKQISSQAASLSATSTVSGRSLSIQVAG